MKFRIFSPQALLWLLALGLGKPALLFCQTPTPTPLPLIGDGMLGSYYNNTTLTGAPDYSRVEESSNFNWFNCSPEYNLIQPDNFSARISGFLVPPQSAPYTFILSPQNAGVSMLVDNNVVISQWTTPSSAPYTAVVTLAAATPVPLEVDYYTLTGAMALNLSWKYPAVPGLQLVTRDDLYSGQPETPISSPQIFQAQGIACASVTQTEDGVFAEPSWSGGWTPITKTVDGSTAGTSAQFKVLWDSQYLYVGVTVLKANLYSSAGQMINNDSIEVFLNTDDSLTSINQSDDFGFSFGWNNPTPTERLSRLTGVLLSTTAISGGYTLETAIPWSTLGIAPLSGETLGFDVMVNESASGCRQGAFVWNGAFYDTVDPRNFGQLNLAACSLPPPASVPFVSPNPFTPANPPNDKTSFNLSPYHGSGHLIITDLRRRKVRSIDFPAYQSLSWDGRDDAGNWVPPGVYVFILQVDGKVHRSTVTVMR